MACREVPHVVRKTLTFIAALRVDRVDAPWVIDGPINGELFTLYVEKILAPTLAKGDVVILDNLGSHKGRAARRAVRQAGANILFSPSTCPDLNPIEQLFAKLKHLMRMAEPRNRRGHTGRTNPRPLLPSRMRQLSQKLRICFRMKTACSKALCGSELSCCGPHPEERPQVRSKDGPTRCGSGHPSRRSLRRPLW